MPFDLITGAAISLPFVQQEQQEEESGIEFKRLVVVNKSKSKPVSRFVRMHKRKRRTMTNRRLLKIACILLACIHKSINGCRQA